MSTAKFFNFNFHVFSQRSADKIVCAAMMLHCHCLIRRITTKEPRKRGDYPTIIIPQKKVAASQSTKPEKNIPCDRRQFQANRILQPCKEEWRHHMAWRCQAYAQTRQCQFPFPVRKFRQHRHQRDLHRRRQPCTSWTRQSTKWRQCSQQIGGVQRQKPKRERKRQ